MKTQNALGLALCAAGLVAASQAALADVTFFENDNFNGRSVVTGDDVRNLSRYGFNDRASSVTVDRGRWEVCEDVNFGGHCAILRPGSYNSLRAMGLNDRISSVRRVGWNEPVASGSRYDARPRRGERLYEANVISVRAIVGPPEQRCWVERQSVVEQGGNRTGGAIAGALIGGILGHQIGGGSGRDLATVGGVVAGAAVGSNIAGNQGDRVVQQDVQRCRTGPSQARADFWDVAYTFRGIEHHVQTTEPPGPTITVNSDGEPRERD